MSSLSLLIKASVPSAERTPGGRVKCAVGLSQAGKKAHFHTGKKHLGGRWWWWWVEVGVEVLCWVFSGVVNNMWRTLRDGEPLIYWKWLALSPGGHNDSIMLKEYHKDQANTPPPAHPITPPPPHQSHLRPLRGVHGKWKRLESNQYRCNSVQLSASSLQHRAVVSLSYPLVYPPQPPSAPCSPPPTPTCSFQDMLSMFAHKQ